MLKKDVEYQKFVNINKSESRTDTDTEDQFILQQLTIRLKADLKIGEPSMENGAKLVAYDQSKEL